MNGRVFKLIVAITIAVTFTIWAAMPAGYVAAVWPLALLASWFPAMGFPGYAAYLLHSQRMDRAAHEALSLSSAQWVRARLADLGLANVNVTDDEDTNGYDSQTRTIYLAGSTYGEHTVRARAIAAHELGHAISSDRTPRLEAVLRQCRHWWLWPFMIAIQVLAANALIGTTVATHVALGLFIVAAVMTAGTLVSDALACKYAREVLADDSELSPDARSAATRLLSLAFTTYASALLVVVLPLVFWSALISTLGTGVVVPTVALAGLWRVLALAVAVAIPLVAVIAVVSSLVGRDDPVTEVGGLIAVASAVVLPFWVYGLAGQAPVLDHSWVLLPAGVVAFRTALQAPAALVTLLVAQISPAASALAPPGRLSQPHGRISSSRRRREQELCELERENRLTKRERLELEAERARHRPPTSSWYEKLWAWNSVLLVVPMALAYLGWL